MSPISILLCALGGEGGSVLADWLVAAARHAGHAAQATSVPGVAQRTGATTYYLEIFPVPDRQLGGRRPVLGLNPLPGRLDALVSSELLETARQIGHGMVSPTHTLVISHDGRTLTTAEKMILGDGRRDTAELVRLVAEHSREHHLLDMARLTREAATVVSAVLFGCIAASGLLPWGRAHCEAVLAGDSASARASRKGFVLGHDALSQPPVPQAPAGPSPSPPLAQTPSLPAELRTRFPAPVHAVLALGHARLCDYQGAGYARLYTQRLEQVQQAEAPGEHAVTQESARWLALWMAFDDIARVADLKSRASRWQRLHSEVRPGAHDLLKVYDHFKPGLPEIAGLLPTRLARALLRIDQRRSAHGLAPWALPLRVATHSVLGTAALRLLAGLRVLRPWGSRYAAEQALIGQWLNAVQSSTRENAALGLEVARCGQLIKGYGSTHERGVRNLLHILQQVLPQAAPAPEKAAAIATIRAAALQDEAGKALDQALSQHGAAPRPVREQPIRWLRPPRGQRV